MANPSTSSKQIYTKKLKNNYYVNKGSLGIKY